MSKKRVTLPKNFDELITAGDIEALKAVYDKCELTAHDGRYSLNTAILEMFLMSLLSGWWNRV